MIAFWSITGGLVLLAVIIFPMGTATTSGTRYHVHKPFKWSDWASEAKFCLRTLNPWENWRDAAEGYESYGTAVVMTLAATVALVGVATALSLIGFGVWLLWQVQ